jgi:hypothetical protein
MSEEYNYLLIRLNKIKGTKKNASKVFTKVCKALRLKKPLYLIFKDKIFLVKEVLSVMKEWEIGRYIDIQVEDVSKFITIRFWYTQPDKPLDVYIWYKDTYNGE